MKRIKTKEVFSKDLWYDEEKYKRDYDDMKGMMTSGIIEKCEGLTAMEMLVEYGVSANETCFKEVEYIEEIEPIFVTYSRKEMFKFLNKEKLKGYISHTVEQVIDTLLELTDEDDMDEYFASQGVDFDYEIDFSRVRFVLYEE